VALLHSERQRRALRQREHEDQVEEQLGRLDRLLVSATQRRLDAGRRVGVALTPDSLTAAEAGAAVA